MSNFVFRSLSANDDCNTGFVPANPDYSENVIQTVFSQVSNSPTNLISCTESFSVPFLYANSETPFRIAMIKKEGLNIISNSEIFKYLNHPAVKPHVFRQHRNTTKSRETCVMGDIPSNNITLVFSLNDAQPLLEKEKSEIIVSYLKDILNIKEPFYDENDVKFATPILNTLYKNIKTNIGKYAKKLEPPYEKTSRYEAVVALMSPALLKLAENPNDAKSLQVVQIFSECFSPQLDASLKSNKSFSKKSDTSFKMPELTKEDFFLNFADDALLHKPDFHPKQIQEVKPTVKNHSQMKM